MLRDAFSMGLIVMGEYRSRITNEGNRDFLVDGRDDSTIWSALITPNGKTFTLRKNCDQELN